MEKEVKFQENKTFGSCSVCAILKLMKADPPLELQEQT